MLLALHAQQSESKFSNARLERTRKISSTFRGSVVTVALDLADKLYQVALAQLAAKAKMPR